MGNPNYKYENGKINILVNGKWIEPSFSEYEELTPLGNPGANGVVIQGTHKTTKRTDAIKIWLPRMRNGKNIVRIEQFEAEVQKIAKLNDSRIATIYNAWQENGCCCCSMELIQGVTFEEWLISNTDMYNRICMLKKVFEAILFYQEQGIVHGDIHSKNIMIDNSNNVHIIDFGTSVFSSYKNQSIHRENVLMYELVKDTLAEQFDGDAFDVKYYGLDNKINNRDDIRESISLFLTKSILSYLELVNMILYISDSINIRDYIYEYCRYIVKGYYLNIDYFYGKVIEKKPGENEFFANTMYGCLEDEMFSDSQDDYNEALKCEYLSLYVYYEFVKELFLLKKIEEKSIKEEFCNISSSYNLENCNYLYDAFCEQSDLVSFHKNLQDGIPKKDIEKDLRSSLFCLISNSCGGYLIYALREISMRMDIIKTQEELYCSIIHLSSEYCYNNPE